MPTVIVEKLEPGMVIKADVRDPLDRLLVAAGTVVTDRHSKILEKWGIRVVDVVGDAGADQKPVSAETVDDAQRVLQDRFHHADLNHPFTAELFNQCVQRKARALAAEVQHAG
jgi:hypothetical protein